MHDESTDASRASRASDLELVRGVCAKDERSIGAFVHRLARVPGMVRAQNRRIGSPLDPDEVADVAQETFKAVWVKLSEFEGRSALDTWIFRFARNELYKAVERKCRRERVEIRDLVTQPQREPEPVPGIDAMLLHAAVRKLDPREEAVIRARHFEGRSFEEFASASSEPLGTVKARYYRAIEKLRAALAGQWRKAQR